MTKHNFGYCAFCFHPTIPSFQSGKWTAGPFHENCRPNTLRGKERTSTVLQGSPYMSNLTSRYQKEAHFALANFECLKTTSRPLLGLQSYWSLTLNIRQKHVLSVDAPSYYQTKQPKPSMFYRNALLFPSNKQLEKRGRWVPGLLEVRGTQPHKAKPSRPVRSSLAAGADALESHFFRKTRNMSPSAGIGMVGVQKLRMFCYLLKFCDARATWCGSQMCKSWRCFSTFCCTRARPFAGIGARKTCTEQLAER